MAPANTFLRNWEIILLTKLAFLSTISCSKLPVSAGEVNMTCKTEYRTTKMADIKLWFQFDSDISANMSVWEFRLEKCEPNAHNNFCQVWEEKDMNIKLCNMIVGSFQVFCIKQINLYNEVTTTKPSHYRFYASHSSQGIVSKEIGKIRYLQCECKYFDFGQKLKTTFSYSRRADIRIEPFYDIPKLIDTKLKIAPNNALTIEKNNDKHFEISGLEICQKYDITVKLKTWPSCTNWKIKSVLSDIPFEGLAINDVSCKYSHTHATLNISADSDSQFYYNVSFMNETFMKNVTRKIILPRKRVKKESQKNLTAFVKLCAHGCRKCGIKRVFICYSEILTKKRKEESFNIMSPYIWILLGIIFFGIFIALLWVKYMVKAKRSNIKGIRDFPKERLINAKVHESLNREGTGKHGNIHQNHHREDIDSIKADNEK